MKTVQIVENFDGYPSPRAERGKKGEDGYVEAHSGARVSYRKGQTVEVPARFADLIVEKGHAKFVTDDAAEPKAKKGGGA